MTKTIKANTETLEIKSLQGFVVYSAEDVLGFMEEMAGFDERVSMVLEDYHWNGYVDEHELKYVKNQIIEEYNGQ